MTTNRMLRVNEILRREIADTLFKVLNDQGVDISTLTITRVRTSNDLRRARVMLSVRGNEQDRQNVLNAVRRHRKELQAHINKDVTLKYTPHLNFELDGSIEAGDHVLQILSEIEEDQAATAGEEGNPSLDTDEHERNGG